MNRRQFRARVNALFAGLATIAAICVTYALGGLDRLELMALDLRFRRVASLPQDPRIVCIDIDDGSLELAGRWPWPRDDQAALIAIPAELGATHILVDVTWSEAEPLRTTAPAHADIVSDPLTFSAEDARVLYPDHELRAALAAAGNVYLAYHYEYRDADRSDLFEAAVAAVAAGDEDAAAARVAELLAQRRQWGRLDTADRPADLLRAVRLIELLTREPTLPSVEAARRLGEADATAIERIYQRAHLAALRRIATQWLDAEPARWSLAPHQALPQLFATLSDRPLADDSAFKEGLIVAFREVLGRRATLGEAHQAEIPLAAVNQAAAPVEGLVPVYYLHARAARRNGYVVFEPDVDGVMRRMRLVGRHGGQVLEQLAFAVACDALGVHRPGVRVDAGHLVLPFEDPDRPPLRVQLAADGRMLVPCVAPRQASDGGGLRPHIGMYRHVPAARILDVHNLRRQIAENELVIRDAIELTLASDLFPAADDYAERLATLKSTDAAMHEARLRGDLPQVAMLTSQRAAAAATVRAHELEVLAPAGFTALGETLVPPAAGTASGPASAAADEDPLASVRAELLASLTERCRPYAAANAGLRRELEDALGRLREELRGAICLIGYTATSLADMAPMPTDRRAPGVMAHANVLNGLLTGRTMRWASLPANIAAAALFGLWTCYLTVFRPPREAVFYLVCSLGAVLFLAFWFAFRVWNLWIAVTPILLVALATFVTISIYVYIFVDRERRQLSTALGQYTSKQIARQVSENPELCQRAEMRVVTSMFTDLRGFTTISERIGAAQTQSVLNTCLGRFTNVMLAQDALVNKFMGDGVFVFWNPVINPQADHAFRACQTALDLLAALEDLRVIERGRNGSVYDELFMRIGVATGNAVVGPCGSDLKWDYTCIGDSVNLAARLESANKFYGTAVLASGPTRDEVQNQFTFRPLGRVQVKGKTEGVRVYELLGRTGQVPAADVQFAERFAAAVEQLERREWRAAIDAFEKLSQERPADLAAQSLLEATIRFLASPPGDDWNGAIELTEK